MHFSIPDCFIIAYAKEVFYRFFSCCQGWLQLSEYDRILMKKPFQAEYFTKRHSPLCKILCLNTFFACYFGNYSLFLRKRRAGRLPAVAGAAASDIHMLGNTFIIAVIGAVHRLAVNTDCLARMLQ